MIEKDYKLKAEIGRLKYLSIYLYLIYIPHYSLTPKQCVINIPIRTHYLVLGIK